MSQNIKIQNEELLVVISTYGAEIQSVTKNSREYIWEGNEEVWSDHAPVLFPICGGLKDDKYTYNSREYSLPKHGYANTSEFELDKATETSATFLLRSNSETFKMYPFEYELRITYSLEGSTLKAVSEVSNVGENDMYYAIGAHEGYIAKGGLENYTVIFENTEDIKRRLLDGILLSRELEDLASDTNELPLKDEYFAEEAIVFSDLKSRSLELRNNETGERIRVSYDGFDYLLIWTKPGAEFVCIEPWCCLPDSVTTDGDITHKPGMICVKAGEKSLRTHIIEF